MTIILQKQWTGTGHSSWQEQLKKIPTEKKVLKNKGGSF